MRSTSGTPQGTFFHHLETASTLRPAFGSDLEALYWSCVHWPLAMTKFAPAIAQRISDSFDGDTIRGALVLQTNGLYAHHSDK